jgi:23S rRNA pseudouridine2605 synthase
VVRINRYLSHCGLGSRRKVEALVRNGRVRINGEPCVDLATTVEPGRDRVELDGRLITANLDVERVHLYHKPLGVVCSFRRQGRAPCLPDVLPSDLLAGRLFHVGRLDRDSSGLLLLTGDGDLAHRLLHPSHPVWKVYEVESDIELSPHDLDLFRSGGLELDGRRCRPCRIRPRGESHGRHAYVMELQEGRKRQIRRMFGALGGQVLLLHRVAFGPVELGDLDMGAARPARPDEVRALQQAAGLTSPGADVDEGEGGH